MAIVYIPVLKTLRLQDVVNMIDGTFPYLLRDGSMAMTGPLAMGGNKITGLAAGAAATDAARIDQLLVTGPATITPGAAITAAGYDGITGRNSTATGADMIAAAFSNYNGYDVFRAVGELPVGSTVIQLNGMASFVRTQAASSGVGFGGLAVSYFGGSVVNGNGTSPTQRTGVWFGNGALIDDATPGNYYSSAANRALNGVEIDIYNYRDDTLAIGFSAFGNSRVKPGQSFGYIVGNMAQPLYYTGNTTNGSTTISALSNPSLMFVGQTVKGAGIPAKTHVVSINVGASTCVINNAATATATSVNLSATIAWDYGFISQDGAAFYGAFIGALDAHPNTLASYSQYLAFRYRDNTGAYKLTTLQADNVGDIVITSGGLHIPSQNTSGAASFSSPITLTYNTGAGFSNTTLQSDPGGNLYASGGMTVGSTYLLKSSVSLFSAASSNTATLTNSPVAGNPTKWIQIVDNGVIRYIPAW